MTFADEWLPFLLNSCGLPAVVRLAKGRQVTIVNYHDPSPDTFERHMVAFSRRFTFVSIGDLAAVLSGCARGDNALPRCPMLVTLDDGHAGNALLFDTIRKYRVPVLLYATAGIVDTRRAFWFDRVRDLHGDPEALKRLPDRERRSVLQRHYGHEDTREYDERSALTRDELLTLLDIGGTIGAHSLFHPILSQCDDETGFRECAESRQRLESMLGVAIRHFALPNGSGDARTDQWLRAAGYETCRTTVPGWNSARTPPLRLRNFGVSDTAGTDKAVLQSSGVWDGLRRVANKCR